MSKAKQVLRSVGSWILRGLEDSSPSMWMWMAPVPYRFWIGSDDR